MASPMIYFIDATFVTRGSSDFEHGWWDATSSFLFILEQAGNDARMIFICSYSIHNDMWKIYHEKTEGIDNNKGRHKSINIR